jgi:hypothetical protein
VELKYISPEQQAAAFLSPQNGPQNEARLSFMGVELELVDDEAYLSRAFPTDDLGLPLPINVPRGFDASDGYNTHHHVSRPKSLRRHYGEMGDALRGSRVQTVPMKLHLAFNERYDNTLIPSRQIGRFGMLLMMVAGYQSGVAIDVSAEEHIRVPISRDQRDRIWRQGLIRPHNSGLKEYIERYVMDADISHVDEDKIQEFILAENDRKWRLGQELFRLAADVAVEPVSMEYLRAWRRGRLPRIDLRGNEEPHYLGLKKVRAVPNDPRLFVVRHISGDGSRSKQVINRYQQHLSNMYAA